MNSAKRKYPGIFPFNYNRFRNKYLLAFMLFVLWLAFFDENNLVERFQNLRELWKLRENKEYFINKIEEDAERLKELKTNKENLEKYAREQYLMKRDNEDVFIIVKE
jgi:cell division protein DivIC